MFERLTEALHGRYSLVRELGRGGMATVYLAEDVRHRRKVALKVLHPELSAVLGPERFLKEIELTAGLQHPHILPLFDSGEAAGQLFYVMPFVEGETLRARLERERQLPIGDALQLAREVADALHYAHGHKVIHRDIKPENILLQGGHALVADFGIALAVEQAGGTRMTQTGLSLGTPQYMSPEQAMGERTIDARSDVYALGAVAYEMLAGEPPFTGATVQQIVARVLAEEPRALIATRKAIPDAVDAAIMRALEKLPADRFATAAEFAVAIENGRTGGTRTRGVRRQARPSRGATIGLGALAAAGLTLAAWGWMRPDAPPEVVRYRILVDSVPSVRDWRGEIAISPDGSTLVRRGGRQGALLVRKRHELGFTALEGTRDAVAPFFSNDGKRIGWIDGDDVLEMPITGGPATVIGKGQSTSESIVWGRDGRLYRNTVQDGRFVIGVGAVTPEPVTRLDSASGELSHLVPELLPDGRGLLFQVAFANGDRKIAVGDITNRTHAILVDGARARYAPSGHLVYTTLDGRLWAAPFDMKRRRMAGEAVQVAERVANSIIGPTNFAISGSGTLVYLLEDQAGQRVLSWVDRAGRITPFDSTWKAEFGSPAISPDGARVAVSIHEGSQNHIWMVPARGGSPNRLTVQNQNNIAPAWSPDGQWVSYIVGKGSSNSGDVWRQPANGSGRAERIATSPRELAEHAWVPGSNDLLVRTTTATEGSGDVLVLSPGAASLTPFLATGTSEYSPSASPDGRFVAYSSYESGRLEVYVRLLADGRAETWPVSAAGGMSPRWSPKGDEIFFIDAASNLVAAQVTTTPAFQVLGTRTLFNASDFVLPSISRPSFDVTPDGQRFLMVQRADASRSGQIIVVEHLFDKRGASLSRR